MLVVLAAGSALGSAIPARAATTKSFSIQQVANPNYVRNGPSALLKTYLKYGVAAPQNVLQAAGQGSETTTPEMYDVRIIPACCGPRS